MQTIIGTLAVLGGLGLGFGLLLAFAAAKLRTNEDPRLETVRDLLPGANCGGCGCAGCGAFAEDLFTGKANVAACPVGGSELTNKLAEIIGTEAPVLIKKTAFIKCIGNAEKSRFHYIYRGVDGCLASSKLSAGGQKACTFGCLGGGDCVRACVFDAIHIVDGIAVVDPNNCTNCGVCITKCPRKLIEPVDATKTVRIGCNAQDGNKFVRESCTIGCIGCKLCVRKCTFDAIEITGQLAKINYEKCTNCGVCIIKCPRKVIM